MPHTCWLRDQESARRRRHHPRAAREQIPANWSGSHRSGAVVPGWIRTFGDPELTALVEDAVVRNPDLKAAAARVEASRYAVRVAAVVALSAHRGKVLGNRQGMELGGDLGSGITPPGFGGIPGIDDGGGSSQDTSVESSTQRWVYGLGIGAAWEADVWGRMRSKKAAAQAESDALASRLRICPAVARRRRGARVFHHHRGRATGCERAGNTELYQEYFKLTDVRKEQGHASDFDVSQIKSRTAAAQDALYVAQAARAQAIRAIEVVTSHYPAGRLATRRSFPGQPRAVPAGLPSQLLERRPDVIAAERRFAAAFHRVYEARAARLPRFAISGIGGLGTAQLDGVGTLDAFTWSLAAGITQPIFFGGELKAAQDIRTAEQKAAAASYVATALRAFEDVEDALANDYYLRKREGALTEVVSNSAVSVKLGGEQLEQGQVDMFTILRLAGENLAAKVQLTTDPRLPPARTREPAPRPRRRLQRHRRDREVAEVNCVPRPRSESCRNRSGLRPRNASARFACKKSNSR